jgi:adenylate cyclase
MADKKQRPFIIPLIVLLLAILALQASGLLDRIDHRVGDSFLALHANTRTPPDDIVLIAIDQKSLEAMNDVAGSWPWPRAIHGELIDGLARFSPKAIGFDILFNEADSFRPDSDAVLRDIARTHNNLFFPSLLLADGNGAPLKDLPASMGVRRAPHANDNASAPLLVPLVLDPANWQGGLINFEKDSDQRGRHARLFRRVHGWELPGLSASMVRHTGTALPTTETIRLHWYGRAPRTISYSDLFNDLSSATPVLAPTLKNSLVIVGATAPGLNDFRPTPLGALTPGAEVLTTAIANLRHDDWLRDWPVRWPLLLLLLTGLVWAFARRHSPLRTGVALSALTLLLLGGSYAALSLNAYAPIGATLALAWLAYGLLTLEALWQERREREAAVMLFRRFLDPRVVDDLVKTGELSREKKPEARTITILFSDIRGFTTLSESRSPEAVVELLNRYFTQQVDVIFRHGGTLDKFIGDAIMAFWNAPTENPHHAEQAVAAALDMARALDEFKRELAKTDGSLDDFDIGIGVHTGPAVVGFLGSDDRLDYTAIGDTVNLASRIEGCTKGIARVLVSGATREACGSDSPFNFANHGQFHVKGREQGVDLFEPILR